MNVWLAGATAALVGFLPLLWVAMRATRIEALVALQSAQALATVVLLLMAEGFHNANYFVLPLVLSALAFVGTLLYARFMGRHL